MHDAGILGQSPGGRGLKFSVGVPAWHLHAGRGDQVRRRPESCVVQIAPADAAADARGGEQAAIDRQRRVLGEGIEYHRAAHAFARHDQGEVRVVLAQYRDGVHQILDQQRGLRPSPLLAGLPETALVIGVGHDALSGQPWAQIGICQAKVAVAVQAKQHGALRGCLRRLPGLPCQRRGVAGHEMG